MRALGAAGDALMSHDASEEGASAGHKRMAPLAKLERWFARSRAGDDDLIVVVVEDTECFRAEVMCEFISICVAYHAERSRALKFLLVLGLSSTSISGVHAFLPRTITGRMRMRKFYTPDSLTVFDKLVRVLFIDRVVPLRLGPKTLSWLSNRFLGHDYSLEGFLCALKYILLDHYWKNDLSFLCDAHHEYSLVQSSCKRTLALSHLRKASESVAGMLTDEDMEAVARLPSVEAYFELPAVKQSKSKGGRIASRAFDRLDIPLARSAKAHRLKWGVAFECFFSAYKILFNTESMSRRKLLVATYGLNVYGSVAAGELRVKVRYASWNVLEKVLMEWKRIFVEAGDSTCGTLFRDDVSAVQEFAARVPSCFCNCSCYSIGIHAHTWSSKNNNNNE